MLCMLNQVHISFGSLNDSSLRSTLYPLGSRNFVCSKEHKFWVLRRRHASERGGAP
jgi:hypothetical protein